MYKRQLLDRLRMDCEYFLGAGQHSEKDVYKRQVYREKPTVCLATRHSRPWTTRRTSMKRNWSLIPVPTAGSDGRYGT